MTWLAGIRRLKGQPSKSDKNTANVAQTSSHLRTSLKSETRVLTMPKMWQWCISACNIGQVLIMQETGIQQISKKTLGDLLVRGLFTKKLTP